VIVEIIIIIIFIHTRGVVVITYNQANKINTDTNTKSALIDKVQ